MTHFFSFITHAKVEKIVLSGESDNPSPLVFAEGIVYIYSYSSGKRGILILNIVYKKQRRIISPIKIAYLN
jgi:hypothetical protein